MENTMKIINFFNINDKVSIEGVGIITRIDGDYSDGKPRYTIKGEGWSAIAQEQVLKGEKDEMQEM